MHGRQIEYQWRDDEGDPPTNLAMSEELVEQEEVFAVLESSAAASGGAQYLDDSGVPVIHAGLDKP